MDATRTIVVGVDGSTSGAAVEWAAAHAAWTGAHVHLLHCPEEAPETAADLLELAALRARSFGAPSCSTALVGLPPGPALVAAADDAAMVVVGARSGGARLGLSASSVGGHVGRFAPCPVAIVPDVPREFTGVLELDLRSGDNITAAVDFALAFATTHDLKIRTSRPAPAASGTRGRYAVPTLEREWEGAEIVVLPAPGPGASPWSARGHLTEIAVRHARCPVILAR